jgi:RNA polymerase sigma factor (sigma-70 family)
MDDLEFVQRCVKGDKESWDEFIAKYSRLIYNYIHHCLEFTGLNALRHDTVDDLFQEVFCGLMKDDFKKLRGFKGKHGCSLASWLRQITITTSLDYLRRIRPTLSLDQENDDNTGLASILPDGSASVREALVDIEKIKNLKECITTLTTDDRYFLELYIRRNLSLEALRKVLRISRGAADMRRGRIIERLKKCFKHKGFALDL